MSCKPQLDRTVALTPADVGDYGVRHDAQSWILGQRAGTGTPHLVISGLRRRRG
jgi:hypothetical protein